MKSVAISLLALGVAFSACAQTQKTEPAPDPGSDFLEGVFIDPPTGTQADAPDAGGDEVSDGLPPEQDSDFLEGVFIDPPTETQAGAPDASGDEVSDGLPPEQGSDFLEGVFIDPPAEVQAGATDASGDEVSDVLPPEQGSDTTVDLDDIEIDLDFNMDDDRDNIQGAPSPDGLDLIGQEPDGPASATEDGEDPTGRSGMLAAWLEPLRTTLQHETSYKFASPKRVVNNRSSVRLEYSKPLTSNLYLRLDTKLNLHWSNDHRAKAKDEDLFRELVTREAYLQSSFGNTSFRLGYQILPWGVSEGGAITDEVSPRNISEYFFISLEESRIGQPMLTMDHFGGKGQWTAFFVPLPAYNKYPGSGSEYDIPGAFEKSEPDDSWGDTDTYEYGARWKRTFGKSDVSLMVASLIDNDYLVRQQRFQMYGFAANIAKDNVLLRAEVALKQPRAYFARPAGSSDLSIVESDQFDSSFGFNYSPGGRALTYSAEVVWSRLLDWRNHIVGRERDEYSLVGLVSNRFFNDDLTLSWLTIYTEPYASFQHRFLSSYLIDDNSTVYFELFYPDERDERSGTWPYRDQKQFVIRY
ncbi:MAG: hypothetical protein M3Q42_10635, partial [Pseudomonadota bacterium]|nr:hypothetical protein [Pseudomonadota bacterium]